MRPSRPWAGRARHPAATRSAAARARARRPRRAQLHAPHAGLATRGSGVAAAARLARRQAARLRRRPMRLASARAHRGDGSSSAGLPPALPARSAHPTTQSTASGRPASPAVAPSAGAPSREGRAARRAPRAARRRCAARAPRPRPPSPLPATAPPRLPPRGSLDLAPLQERGWRHRASPGRPCRRAAPRDVLRRNARAAAAGRAPARAVAAPPECSINVVASIRSRLRARGPSPGPGPSAPRDLPARFARSEAFRSSRAAQRVLELLIKPPVHRHRPC
jgi:hypothetical protein